MSGLKISFDKSEVLTIGVTELEKCRVANLLNCKLGKFPMKYLGLTISDLPPRVADWEFLPDKVILLIHRRGCF
jgi:hypothetical protein